MRAARGKAVLLGVAAFFVFLTGAAIRLRLAASQPMMSGDAGIRYAPLALNLAAGNGFSTHLSAPYAPDDFSQPGYPLFVAAIYRITHNSNRAVLVVQLIAELAILWLVWLISKEFGFAVRHRWLAVGIGWLCPFLVLFARTVMTEVLCTLVLVVIVYLFLLASRRDGFRLWALAGACGGICLLIRPDALVCIGLLAVAAWTVTKRYMVPVIFCLSSAVMLVPWVIRNYKDFGALRPLGRVAEQTDSPYVHWLDTWVDDPKYIPGYWWCESGGNPNADYQALVQEASPVVAHLIVPMKRTAMTVARVPNRFGNEFVTASAYLLWFAMLPLSIIGVALMGRQRGLLFLVAIILGRLALPFLSSLGADPRYLIEMLPALYILVAAFSEKAGMRFAVIRHGAIFGNRLQPADA